MLKPTKHATTNYRMLKKFLDVVDENKGYARFLPEKSTPLYIEYLYDLQDGRRVYGMSQCDMWQYYIQDGQMVSENGMSFAVDDDSGTISPLTFLNESQNTYQEVYNVTCWNGELVADVVGEYHNSHMRTKLDNFLWCWLKDIHTQGFDPSVYDKKDKNL